MSTMAGHHVRVVAMLLALLLPVAGCAQDSTASVPPSAAQGAGSRDPMRRNIPLDEEGRPLLMQRVENTDARRQRAFPEQPPTIPHSIDGYQIDKGSNHCLLCHSRAGAVHFQAPMVSVTHYWDSKGQVLASISARRYFCTQCHVVQTNAKLLVGNGFRDVDELIRTSKKPRS